MFALEAYDPPTLAEPDSTAVMQTVAIFMAITLVGTAIGGYYGNRYHDRPLTGATLGAVAGAVPAWFVSRAYARRVMVPA
jgi:hypothetical protein